VGLNQNVRSLPANKIKCNVADKRRISIKNNRIISEVGIVNIKHDRCCNELMYDVRIGYRCTICGLFIHKKSYDSINETSNNK
jgi:hypothetical protein